jgi:hypothetical protein
MLGPSPPKQHLIIDTGCSSHYFSTEATLPKTKPTPDPIPVQLANQDFMYSTHTAELPIPQLPPTARQVHIFPDLGPTSLISAGQVLDAGREARFTTTERTFTHQGKEILHGKRNATTNNLWTTTLPTANPTVLTVTATTDPAPQPENPPPPDPWITLSPKPGQALPAVQHSGTQRTLVAYAHGAMGSPSLSTMETALVKDFLPQFPGLTLKSFRNNLPNSEATAFGHLDNIRKNTRSTKKAPKKPTLPPADPYDFPPQPEDTTRTHACFLAITETKECVYTDQTGRLPQPSSDSNNYILIAYDYDSNCIFMRPLPNRNKAESLTAAIANIHATLSKGGCKPKFHCLDNECPQLLKDYFAREGIEYQLVHPTTIEPMQQSAPSGPPRTTLQPPGPAPMMTSQCTCGTKLSHQRK